MLIISFLITFGNTQNLSVMKRKILNLLLLIVMFATLSGKLSAEPRWGSEWKLFFGNKVFDKEYKDFKNYFGIRHPSILNYVQDVAVDKNGATWLAISSDLYQYNELNFEQIKGSSFGTHRGINDLAFDEEGNLWIGTTNGIHKYDGSSFTNMEVPEIVNVTEIAIAPDGKIYVAGLKGQKFISKGGGLAVYDGASWKNYNSENSNLPDNYVEDLSFDSNNNLWLVAGKEDRGVTMFDGSTWTNYDKANSGLESNKVRAIEFDKNGVGWFGTARGLTSFDGEKWETYSMKDLTLGPAYSIMKNFSSEPDLVTIAIDKEDVMWIGTNGEGVIRIDGDARSIIKEENSPMLSDKVHKIIVDPANRKWFITGFSPETWSDRFLSEDASTSSGYRGVVMYGDPVYDHFENWKVYNTYTSQQPGNTFYEIQAVDDGTVYLNSESYGLVSFNDNQWKVYEDPDGGLFGSMLSCLAANNEGTVYAGSQMKGIYIVEDNFLKHIHRDDVEYSSNSIRDLELDNEGNLWIAHVKGLDKYSTDGKIQEFRKKKGLISNIVMKLYKDSKGDIWVCQTKGVSVYKDGQWKSYDKKNNGLKGYVYDITEDSEGNYWAGTGRGLYKLEGDQWIKIEPEKSFGNRYFTIKCMNADKEGRIWIGTMNSGLMSYDGQQWKHYDKTNSGIIFREINDIELTPDGELWISMKKRKSTGANKSLDPTEQADPGEVIKQKIKEFDPSAAIVIHKT